MIWKTTRDSTRIPTKDGSLAVRVDGDPHRAPLLLVRREITGPSARAVEEVFPRVLTEWSPALYRWARQVGRTAGEGHFRAWSVRPCPDERRVRWTPAAAPLWCEPPRVAPLTRPNPPGFPPGLAERRDMHALNVATRISRRSFHKLALAGLGVPAVDSFLPAGRLTDPTFDVLVVGGGVSGAYVAWRLMTGEPGRDGPLAQLRRGSPRRRPRVCLLETSGRIGGRLYTVTQPDFPGFHAELGGMRFLATHQSVLGLADHLGLTVVDFPMGGTGNRQFLRHTNFQLGDYEGNPDRVPYHLLDSARGQLPWHLVTQAFFTVYPVLATMSPDEARVYLKAAEFEGRPLWQVGFWNFLARQLSVDAFNLVRSGSGYHTIVSNWNAYDAIVFVLEDFASPSPPHARRGVSDSPPDAGPALRGAGRCWPTGTTATSLSRGPSEIRVVAVGPDHSRTMFTARHVVLALPRRALELLDPGSFIFTDQFRTDLASVARSRGRRFFSGTTGSGGRPSGSPRALRSPTSRYASATTLAPTSGARDFCWRATTTARRWTSGAGISPSVLTGRPRRHWPTGFLQDLAPPPDHDRRADAPAQRRSRDRGTSAPYRALSKLEPRSLRRGLALLEPPQPIVGGDDPVATSSPGRQRVCLRRSLFLEPGLGGRRHQHGRARAGSSLRHETPELGRPRLQLRTLARGASCSAAGHV